MARPPMDAPQPGPERRGSYEVLSKTEIHNKFGMVVESHRVRKPDGTITEVLPVSFPREATLMAVSVNGSIMGTREQVYGTGQTSIEFSGGVKGEGTAEEAARRKVQEEIGVTTQAASVRPLISVRTDVPVLWNVTHQSIAAVEAIGKAPESPTIKREVIPVEKARSMVLNGEINTANIALQALLIADRLEADGRELPDVETRVISGGKWIHERPRPWKLDPLPQNEKPVTRRGGFDVLERTIKYQTEAHDAQLVHDKIQRPDGSVGDQFFLTYPRQLQAIAVDENGNAYLKKEHSYAYNEEIFTLPGAAIGDTETYGQAAERVAKEQLGVKVEAANMYDLDEWGETTSRMDYKMRFIAVPVKAKDMAERDDLVAVNIAEGWDAVKTGREIDGKKLDTLTPALALGLLKRTQLQAAEHA